MFVFDALKRMANPIDQPQVALVDGTPKELCAAAAAITRGRLTMRDPEREDITIGRMKEHEPAHLTIYEHARWTFVGPQLNRYELMALGRIGGNWVYNDRDDDTGILSMNLSHIRQLATAPLVMVAMFGRSLASVIRDQVDVCLDDLPPPPKTSGWRELPEAELADDFEREMHPTRTFVVRLSRAALDQVITHRSLSPETRSQRVVDEMQDGIGFIYPPKGKPFEDAETEWLQDYDLLRSDGWLPQDARYALPMATASMTILTAPMMSWRDFIWKRGQLSAQGEVRYATYLIRDALLHRGDLVSDLDVNPKGLDRYFSGQPA